MKSAPTRPFRSQAFSRAGLVTATLSLLFCLPLSATVLDNFTGPKTGWTDALNGGSVLQSGGQFKVSTAHSAGALTFSEKTSASFTNVNGHSLEFRVGVDTVIPGSANTNALAILGWVPTGGALLANGYSISVGAADVIIRKGASVLYATNYPGGGLQNTNITIALRMTSSGAVVAINARVYRRVPNGLVGQYFTTLFEYTVTDGSGLIGPGGYAALGVKNQFSLTGAEADFSLLQVFETTTTVLDSFSSGSLDTTKWTVFKKLPQYGDSVTVGPSGLDAKATLVDASGGFAGVYSANTTYRIVDGGQVEFQLDIINNIAQNNSYSALGYIPAPIPQYLYGLVEYHIANDAIGHTVVVSGKGYNEWWGGRNDIQPPYTPPGCRYILTLIGESSNCRIESRIEDLNVPDVNDPARVVWQTEFVDTPAIDCKDTNNPAPYLNFDGRFVIATFNAGIPYPNYAEVIFSNAVVRQTLPGATPPIIANVVPAYSANFLASTNGVSFDVSDAANLPLNGLSVRLNGVTYANGSPGVTITPSSSSSTTRHFALAGALTSNANYVGSVQATNSNSLSVSSPLLFDTFLTNDYLIEVEEFNFSTNGGVSGGVWIDNPLLIADNTTGPNAYNSQGSLAEVDYHDNRGSSWLGGYDANHTFRTTDPVYTSHSSDLARVKYVNAGGIGAGFYETEVTDIYDGDWLNYTHAYPAGTYNVFLRQATFKLLDSLVTLERVTGDPTSINQANAILGTFAGIPTGIGLLVNVPLTDGPGNPMVLRFAGGVDTLQLRDRVTGNANLDNGNLEQNYVVLVPVPDPGTLRPVVVLVSPLANSTLNSAVPVVTATIANRDTTVNLGSIILQINGNTVAATVSPTNNGAFVSYALPFPLPPPNSTVTNTLIFQDSGGVYQTNTWTWKLTYTSLSAASSLPIGSLGVRGFDARMVQSSAANIGGAGGLDNSIASAEAELAIPPRYALDLTTTNRVDFVAWDLDATAYGAVTNFPGLCIPPATATSFAVETFAYLQLTAGVHRFYVDSDDAVGIYSGANLADKSIALVENNGVTHTAFDFVVPADGLYPLHIIYEQGQGLAYLVLKSVNLSDNSQVLVNAPGGVNAFYPLVCKSSTSVAGPYTVDAAANAGNVLATASVLCDGTGAALSQTVTGGTLTVPISGSATFYRLSGPRATRFTNIRRVGSNVVITYQAE